MRICLLVSGGLGYKMLLKLDKSSHEIVSVFTDKKSNEIISYCQQNKIKVFAGNPRKGKASDFIKNIECSILLSINYLFLIESDIISLPSMYAINIHGSLLPKYRGRTPHVWSIINGEKNTGITAHLIDENLDNGDIVKQIIVPIEEEDTGAEILKKYNELYPKLVETILLEIETNTIKSHAQDSSKATVFGKRTPSDGQINWNWSKERIRDWIRAQARPYPGAFTYIDKKKLIIHKATYSDIGFHANQPNGLVLNSDSTKAIIKTSNGALEISEFENQEDLIIEKGKILE